MRSFKKRPKWYVQINDDNLFPSFLPSVHNSIYNRSKEPLWKDKYASPRCELVPCFEIRWLGYTITFTRGNDSLWERWLWIHKYHDGNEDKARETWPWSDILTKESTWYNVREI